LQDRKSTFGNQLVTAVEKTLSLESPIKSVVQAVDDGSLDPAVPKGNYQTIFSSAKKTINMITVLSLLKNVLLGNILLPKLLVPRTLMAHISNLPKSKKKQVI